MTHLSSLHDTDAHSISIMLICEGTINVRLFVETHGIIQTSHFYLRLDYFRRECYATFCTYSNNNVAS